MLSRCCWYAASRGIAAAVAVIGWGLAGPADAATVLEKEVEIVIGSDGAIRERNHLAVRLDTARDLDSWSPYPILLDENRTLESLEAAVRRPDGKTVRVGRRDLDTGAASPDWVLHGSQQLRTVRFPSSPPGSVLLLDWQTLERPYFPSGRLALGERDPIERLSVTLRGAQPLRWRLLAPSSELHAAETPTGVQIDGKLAAPDMAAQALTEFSTGPTLRYAWGPLDSWTAVGRWYQGLAAELPRDEPAVRRQAVELIDASESPRAKLAALLGFARQQVRYVAVEVGIGGYRPAAPGATLERRWGDCKAKAFLLIDLLRAAGIVAHPAIILADAQGRIADFPSPDDFNHLIVAVEAEGLAAAGDPATQGFLFVDPTHPYASPAWISPAVQDQDALVVRGEHSGLVRTPTIQAHERAELVAALQLTPAGAATGRVLLHLEGDAAARLEEVLAVATPAQADQAAQQRLLALLPGATIARATASTTREVAGVPTAVVTGEISLPGLAGLTGFAGTLALPGPETTPSSSLLDGRLHPVVLRPGITGLTFSLTLPPGWTPPADEVTGEDNPFGTFRQSVETLGSTVTVTRRTELRRRIVEPEDFAALRALALAERRAAKRRLRFGVEGSR